MRLLSFTSTSDHKVRRASALLKSSAALALVGAMAGCDTKDFLNPTAMVRSGHPSEPLVVPILSMVDPVAEAGPGDYATATAPRPSDLVSSSSDYTIGRNDGLNVSISDLQGPGQETVKVARVSESGNISLPYLGSVHAQGLTEIELEQQIVQAYRDANLIQNAQVSVTVTEPRGRTVQILGAVNGVGQYAILDADFRLLDALTLARDVSTPLIEYIYVIRKSESQHLAAQPTSHPAPVIIRPGGAGRPASGPSPEDLAPKSDAGSVPESVARATGPTRPLSLVADAPTGADLTPATAPAITPATGPDTAPTAIAPSAAPSIAPPPVIPAPETPAPPAPRRW